MKNLIFCFATFFTTALWAQMPSFTAPANFEDVPVYRLQIKFVTGTSTDAQTDDRVYIRLNPGMRPYYLDLAHDDREKGKTDVYDVIEPSVKTIRDIQQLYITKVGTDGWGLWRVELLVNGRLIFENNPNRIIDGDNGKSPELNYTAVQLRGSKWNYAQNVGIHIPPLSIPNKDLRDMVEGFIGNHIRYIPNATVNWGSKKGINTLFGDAVESKFRNTQTLEFDLDLQVAAFGPNPELDIDFDLVVNCSNGQVTISVQNAKANVNLLSRFNIDKMRLDLSRYLNRSFNVPVCRAKFNTDGSLSFI
jgi:hypothetical protein